MADTQTLHTNIIKLKAEYAGGLDELERIFAHNTADNGRPPMSTDGTRTYKLAPTTDFLDELQSYLIGQRVSAEGIYWPDRFDFDGRPRARLVFHHQGTEHVVCWMRLDRNDFWTTPDTHSLHREMVGLLEQMGLHRLVVSEMIEPTCPTCNGERTLSDVHVDYIDGLCVFVAESNVKHICQTCMGAGVLR